MGHLHLNLGWGKKQVLRFAEDDNDGGSALYSGGPRPKVWTRGTQICGEV